MQRAFNHFEIQLSNEVIENKLIGLVFDATFFSRVDGVLVFRSQKKNLYWRFIESETLREIEAGLKVLDERGYQFNSFTIDGRKGVIQLLLARYPGVPIQLCHFHQAQIIRRYTTNKPKTECGQALHQLMKSLTVLKAQEFSDLFFKLTETYASFLKEKNEQGEFVHRKLRSAVRSLKSNLPYLFAYQTYPELNIPNTTNSCDGFFAHWKQKVKIHRGLRQHRRNKMIDLLLQGD